MRRVSLGPLVALGLVATLSACSVSTSTGPSKDHGTQSHPQPTKTAQLTVSPLPLGNVGDPADFRPGTATFSPANPGAPVELQVLRGGAWHTLVRGAQDDDGRFEFSIPVVGRPHPQYRVTTNPVGGVAQVVSPVVQTTKQPWQRIFHDDFDGTALDPAKWRTRLQPPTGRRLCATPSPDMVRVEGGHVVLGIKRVAKPSKACPEGTFENAMIGTGETTYPGFAAAYGLYAARVRFQSGKGQHGSFWMQAAEPNGAEIDVAEYFGAGRKDGGISNFVHHTGTDGELTSVGGIQDDVPAALGTGKTASNGWHVWSVQWDPSGYTFRVDDKVTMKTSKSLVSAKEFLILSLLTSDWEMKNLNTTTSTMKVDWVRAWQQ